MARLVDVDRVLALFAEGIAGRPYHIKSPSRVQGRGGCGPNAVRSWRRATRCTQHLPRRYDRPLRRRCIEPGVVPARDPRPGGGSGSSVPIASTSTWLGSASRAFRRPRRPDDRESDFGLFFGSFARPDVARALFRAVETARVQAAVVRRYPGAGRYRQAMIEHRNATYAGPLDTGVLAEIESLEAALDGVAGADSALFPLVVDVLAPGADVSTSAKVAHGCYEALRLAEDRRAATAATDAEPSLEWLQREARLEDWGRRTREPRGRHRRPRVRRTGEWRRSASRRCRRRCRGSAVRSARTSSSSATS